MNDAIRLGDKVSGFYFGEYAFEGTIAMADSSFIYIKLSTACHRYAAGESIAISRREMTRCAIKTIARRDNVIAGYDSHIGARYVAG